MSEPPSRTPEGSTRWSLVLAVRRRSQPEESSRALAELCQTYWPAVYAFVRRQMADLHEAQDLTQAFFAQLLEKDLLAVAEPARGRFRSFTDDFDKVVQYYEEKCGVTPGTSQRGESGPHTKFKVPEGPTVDFMMYRAYQPPRGGPVRLRLLNLKLAAYSVTVAIVNPHGEKETQIAVNLW